MPRGVGLKLDKNRKEQLFTYVLELEDGFWYVGKTANVKQRISRHMAGYGCLWTKLHKPVRLFKVYKGSREKDIVLAFMKIFGIDKVRGWAYSQRVLTCTPQEYRGKIPNKLCDELNVPHLKYKPIPWEVEHKITLPY